MEFNSTTIGIGDGNVVHETVGASVETGHPPVVFGFTGNAQSTLGGARILEGGVGEGTTNAVVEIHRGSEEIDALNRHAVGSVNADGEGLHLDTKVQIIGVLTGRGLVVKSVVRVVEPPLAALVNEFALTFQEVGVVLGLPTHAVAVIGEGPVACVPIGDDATVASEGTQVHDRNRADGIKSRGIHCLVQTGVNARFGASIGEPAFGVGVVGIRQRTFRPVGAVEHRLVTKPSVWPSSRHLFFVVKEQLPAVFGQGHFLNAVAVG